MDNSKSSAEFNEVYHYRNKKLNFMGSILCPLKKKTKSDLAYMLDSIEKETGKKYNCYIADGHGSITDEYSDYWKIDSIEEFPDIIVSKGFDELYKNGLYKNLISKGYFECIEMENMSDEYKDAMFLDDSYTMFGAFLDVFLVDINMLGDLPQPKSWEDLLSPIYKNKIVVSEKSGEVSIPILLNYYKEFGEEGVVSLAKNTLLTVPGKQMSCTLYSETDEKGAIYITSYSSAKSLEREGVNTVVPSDGAAVLPFCMLVKKDKSEELRFLTDYIMETYANGLYELGSISLLKGSEVKKFNWIGWDFVRENDVVDLNKKLQEIYRDNL